MARARIIAWLRVLLPLAALAVLSTLFLVPRQGGVAPPAPGEAASGHIGAPDWAGVTQGGARLRLSAGSATAGADGRIEAARDVVLDWQAPGGLEARVTAPAAGIADAAVTLSGGVALQLSSGWTLTAKQLTAPLDGAALEGAGDVEVAAPFGRLTAGAFRVSGPEGARVLDLDGGVRLIYRP